MRAGGPDDAQTPMMMQARRCVVPPSDVAFVIFVATVAACHVLIHNYTTACVAAGALSVAYVAVSTIVSVILGQRGFGWDLLLILLVCYGLSFAVAMVVGLPFRVIRVSSSTPRDSEYSDDTGSLVATSLRAMTLFALAVLAIVVTFLIQPPILFVGLAVAAALMLRELINTRRRATHDSKGHEPNGLATPWNRADSTRD